MTTREIFAFITAQPFHPAAVLAVVPDDHRRPSDAFGNATEALALALAREAEATGIDPRDLFTFHADLVEPLSA
ncbi:MAG: hypothetical protein KC420_11025 [Myxococcales bacterium]|nr:hypothetical protein [Myxococcales bacterium]